MLALLPAAVSARTIDLNSNTTCQVIRGFDGHNGPGWIAHFASIAEVPEPGQRGDCRAGPAAGRMRQLAPGIGPDDGVVAGTEPSLAAVTVTA